MIYGLASERKLKNERNSQTYFRILFRALPLTTTYQPQTYNRFLSSVVFYLQNYFGCYAPSTSKFDEISQITTTKIIILII